MKLLLALLVALAATPPERQSPLDIVAWLTRGKVENESYHAKLPFEYSTSLITIPAKLGARECRMLVDTGAPMAITQELAKELGAQVLGTYEMHDSAGNKQDREFVLLPTVDVGGARFSDLAAVVVDLNALPELRARRIDGLIGGNLLRHGAIAIDYGAKTIEFAPNAASLAPQEGLEVPFDFSVQAMPIFLLTLGETRVGKVSIDTGSNTFLDLPAEVIDHAGIELCLDIQGSSSVGAFGTSPEGERLCWLEGLALGGTQLQGMVVSSMPAGGALAGNRFFERTQLVIDWPAKKLRVADPKLLGRPNLRTHGLTVRFVEGRVRIATALGGSSADKAKLTPGQRVLAVDEIDVSTDSLAAYTAAGERLRDEARSSATVVVEVDGKPVKFELAREQLLPR